jgi:hypothetical protein
MPAATSQRASASAPRRGTRAACLALMLLLLPGASVAGAARVVTYHWTITGSLRHSWTMAAAGSCSPEGTGLVTASFHSRPQRAIKVFTGHNVPLIDFNPDIAIVGQITATDNTTPLPDPDPTASPCRPIDKSDCAQRPLPQGASLSLVPRPHRWDLTGDNALNSDATCNRGLLQDFTSLSDSPSAVLHPKIPSARTLFTRPRSRTIKLNDTRHDHAGPITATTTRKLTIRLTRG